MRALLLLTILFTSASFVLRSQVQLRVVSLNPAKGVITARHLQNIVVINSGTESFSGIVKTSIEKIGGREPVAQMVTNQFTLNGGEQRSGGIDLPWNRSVFYGQSGTASNFAQRGVLEFGEFVLCVTATDLGGRQVLERCFEQRSVPLQQLLLVYPLNGSSISDIRPNLVWQGALDLMVSDQPATYNLKVVEVTDKQSAATALARNLPVLIRSNLKESSLFYPMDAVRLQPGRKYAWEVRLVSPGGELLRSQQWDFTVAVPEQPSLEPVATSFAMLANSPGINNHLFSDNLRIGLDNNELLTELPYSIYNLTDNHKVQKSLPVVEGLHPGLNTITIPVKSLSLQSGKQYQLRVSTPRKHTYYLQFEIAE